MIEITREVELLTNSIQDIYQLPLYPSGEKKLANYHFWHSVERPKTNSSD